MHARIEHLLSLRDGEPVAAEVAEHVRQCPICSGELQRLSAVRAQMQALPQLEPPAVAFERIRDAMPVRRPLMPVRRVGLAAAAVAIVTLTVIAVLARYSDQRNAHVAATGAEAEQAGQSATPTLEDLALDDLVAQSQQLEQLLQILPGRPRVERVSTAATIDTIEQRIQWLDFQLSYAPVGDLSEEQSRQLWRERVELMDSLVKVRYAEAGRLSF